MEREGLLSPTQDLVRNHPLLILLENKSDGQVPETLIILLAFALVHKGWESSQLIGLLAVFLESKVIALKFCNVVRMHMVELKDQSAQPWNAFPWSQNVWKQ
jgi:hypothetical protein